MRFIHNHIRLIAVLFIALLWQNSLAQENRNEAQISIAEETLTADSVAMDSILGSDITISPDSSRAALKRMSYYDLPNTIKTFKPDPTKATWLAIVIPGGGQIYNRKYWKLPIVYGGFVGCLYAYNWNNQMYKDYRQAFLDIMDADPNTKSYEGFFPSGYDFQQNDEYLKNLFKKRKDRYRRWRDMSVFACVGVYLVSIVDAYVDAHLSSFDISEDINLSIQPDVQPINTQGNSYYGLNCNISF